ncbi:MAG: DUF4417 domain-containing protein [Gemmataceae bacterium]
MGKTSTVSRSLALPMVASCFDCNWHPSCGGVRDDQGYLFGDSCFARHCCGGKANCNYLCPSNPHFARMMNEVEGLNFANLPVLMQRKVRLPLYVPSILHASGRDRALGIPFAAIPVEEVFRRDRSGLRAKATDPIGFRLALGLAPSTRIIINCVRPDADIERLWEYWRQDDLPAQLVKLDIEAVIAPNYSHLQGVPKLEIVGNRMRQLICVRDLANAGLLPVPHLSVIDPANWDWWKRYLQRNDNVSYVAFEFETGYKRRVEGEDAIERLAAVQAELGRSLHLIVVGGTQYRVMIQSHFRSTTFIDASPFWKTVNRYRARIDGTKMEWDKSPLPKGVPLDEMMAQNLSTYTEWMVSPLRNIVGHQS